MDDGVNIASKVYICSSMRVEKFITITMVNMSTTSNLLSSGICDRVSDCYCILFLFY